jgi:hypothetical protein
MKRTVVSEHVEVRDVERCCGNWLDRRSPRDAAFLINMRNNRLLHSGTILAFFSLRAPGHGDDADSTGLAKELENEREH